MTNHKKERLGQRLLREARGGERYRDVHVVVGGTGAVGGATVLQLLSMYEEMMGIQTPGPDDVPVLVATGKNADDLRAFLDNRPISARRTTFVEQAARWVKKQQRSLVLTSAAVAITLLLVVGSSTGCYLWQRSRLAFVRLETDHPPIVAEIFNVRGQAVTPRTTLPMQQAAEVPSGEYRLRLHVDQRFSQDTQISLTPGQHFGQKLDVNDRIPWDVIAVVEGPDKIGIRTRVTLKDRSSGATLGELEEWPPIDCVRVRIIGLHAGPVVVAQQP